MVYPNIIDWDFIDRLKALGLPEKKENNPYLIIHLKGDGVHISENWHVKVYKNNKGQLKLVTTDADMLRKILGETEPSDEEPALYIDDAGWGFPLGGVMIGVSDGMRVETDVVDVKYFQADQFANKNYMEAVGDVAVKLVNRFGFLPPALIRVCPGFVNNKAAEKLEAMGFKVERVAITGLLQRELENQFGDYLRGIVGFQCGYGDPKENHRGAAKNFYTAMDWIRDDVEHRLPLAKTGWHNFKKHLQPPVKEEAE